MGRIKKFTGTDGRVAFAFSHIDAVIGDDGRTLREILEEIIDGGGGGGEGGIKVEKDPTVPAWAKEPQKPSYTASEVGALPSSTFIPTTLSDLGTDAEHQAFSAAEKQKLADLENYDDSVLDSRVEAVEESLVGKANDADLATVAKTGSYQDLSNKPVIPEAYDDAPLAARVSTNEAALTKLNGSGEGSVTKTVTDKIAEVVAQAPEDLNTLKEIADWIAGHEDDAAAMNSAIQANTTALGTKANTADLSEVAFSGSYSDLSNRPTIPQAYDDTVLAGRVTAVETALGGHSVGTDVPANAVFTDTVYDDTTLDGRVSTVEGLLDGHSVATNVPSDALFTDTVYDDTVLAGKVTANETALAGKQDTLVSGTNIKTINNESLLGSGNITIQGGGGSSVEFDALTSSAIIEKVDGGVTERLSIDLEDNTKKIAVDIRNSGINSEKRWHAETEQSLRKDTLTGATPDLSMPNGATFVTTLEPNPLSWDYVVMDNNDAWTGVRVTDTSPFIFNRKGTSTELCRLTVTESSPGEWEVSASDGTLDGKTWNFFVENPVVPRVQSWLDLPEIQTAQATDSTLGTIKLNPSESVGVNENGQLTVGGRLGQFPDGGLYYPTSADPVTVGNYTLLMSEAKGLSAAHRELIIAGGSTVNFKTTAQAGATEYRISNTQTNRFMCLAWVDGRLAVDEASAKEKTVAITSVKFANGNNISAYFGATESNNDIIVTVAETLNPDSTLSAARGYGTWKNADVISAGQGNYVGGGKVLQVGQANVSANGKNQIGMIGIRQYCEGASSLLVGADNINLKAFCALFGQGIDNSTGPEGLAAFGKWPDISSDTAFVIGNGTAYNARSNLFEIKTNGDIYKNGVRVL